ncbi:hypothetical protein K438DRAFT_2023898 [Mycena galopus ATCC 62051]|nr:hypothetical protein K438DRAFT_2023898 [Mycena galopus ATCC 62051]
MVTSSVLRGRIPILQSLNSYAQVLRVKVVLGSPPNKYPRWTSGDLTNTKASSPSSASLHGQISKSSSSGSFLGLTCHISRSPALAVNPYNASPPVLTSNNLRSSPSRPDLYNPDQALSQPMAEQQYKYQEVPLQPVAPVLMRNPSAPGTVYSGSSSDSQSTLTAPIRPYASDAMLIRNNSDDELDKSDAFWRRFNASAAVPDAEKSSWLEKTEGKRSVHSRVLWIVGIIFLILAAGGIAIGVFISFHDSSNTTRPTTIGGAADITGSAAVVTTGAGAVGGTAASSSLHVSPTNTVNDR